MVAIRVKLSFHAIRLSVALLPLQAIDSRERYSF